MGKRGRTRRYFSKEYKLSVVKRNINGESSGKLSKELGLDKSLICHWARAYQIKVRLGWRRSGIWEALYSPIKNEKDYPRKINCVMSWQKEY
jgi:hypothetical protein